MGTRKKAFYRIVVADQRTARDGRFIELLGTYDPKADPPAITLNAERAQGWLAKGAQPSDVVRSIFVREGILEKPVGVASAPKPKAKDAGAEQPASDVATEDAAGNGDAPAESSGTKAEAAE